MRKKLNKSNSNQINEASKKSLEKKQPMPSDKPKTQQLVRMLSFRIVPAYYKKIEKVADDKNTTVSALIRGYIKEGMKRDTNEKNTDFRIE